MKPDSTDDLDAQARREAGIGGFSQKPIFVDGEVEEDAAAEYMRTACVKFADSVEGRAGLVNGTPAYWVRSFLDYTINYPSAV